MNNWEEQWTAVNKNQSQALTRFGADSPTVHTGGAPVVVKQGGGLSNGIMLILSGFAVGTLWGEPIINKLLGVKKT